MELIEYLSQNPVGYTYFAIGSCPHSWGADLEAKYDQLMPVFFQEQIQTFPGTFRAIHYDPAFSRYPEELTDYFQKRGFELVELPPLPCFQCWRSKSNPIEIILLSQDFHHPQKLYPGNDEWILEILCEQIVQGEDEKFLVLQEYTGQETIEVFKRLYQASTDKSKFKRQILFDVSYGVATGCCTDMSKYKPFMDERGFFYNLLLLEPSHFAPLIGKNADMDFLMKQILIQNYRMTLNSYHVDYRRRLRGETILFQGGDYKDSTSPDTIMRSLIQKLSPIAQLLLRFNHISQESYQEFQKLTTTYVEYDVYKWYDAMSKLAPLAYAQ